MSNRKSLHEVIAQSTFVDELELIDVPKQGDAIALLRVKSMPEFAFVMWDSLELDTKSQLGLAGEHTVYTVVCACCPSEVYGVSFDEIRKEEYSDHESKLKAELKGAIADLCRNHGISTLFMRRAGGWDGRYGAIDGLSFKEAARCRDAYLTSYGIVDVEKGLWFIDRKHTRNVDGWTD